MANEEQRGPVRELTDRQLEQVEEREAAVAPVLHEAIRREGELELSRPSSALAWSALAAGLSMGFSLATEGALRQLLPDAPWRPLVANFGYSVGFVIVVLGRQQLFTENTLTPILPLLANRDRRTLVSVARLWAIVLACNVLGAVAFALAAMKTSAFAPAAQRTFVQMGLEAASYGFGTTLLRAVFGGWLLALMVWLLPGSIESRLPIILGVTYVIGLGHFSHSIAGAVETAAAAWGGALSWGDFFLGFLAPAVIGNVIGGVSLVAAINHAQVTAGRGKVA